MSQRKQYTLLLDGDPICSGSFAMVQFAYRAFFKVFGSERTLSISFIL